MKKNVILLLVAFILTLFSISAASAHCEIPCGIYDDQLRIQLIAEDTATIEKSMKQIEALSKAEATNYNQLIRWVSNKEVHATKIQHIVSQYFMTQRIKPGQKKYAEMLSVLHQMLLAAMKCKQSTDLHHIDTLRSLLKKFEGLYFEHEQR